ncbi:MAG: hypothetical protein M3Q58_03290, partial [Bacteroidota bacterium]|nr:hypothetical protein [Bacteroidota bacterium]
TLHTLKWGAWCILKSHFFLLTFAARWTETLQTSPTCGYAGNVSRKHCAPVGQTGQSAFFIEKLLCNFQHLKQAIASCFVFFLPA